jgi:hypothetical protein
MVLHILCRELTKADQIFRKRPIVLLVVPAELVSGQIGVPLQKRTALENLTRLVHDFSATGSTFETNLNWRFDLNHDNPRVFAPPFHASIRPYEMSDRVHIVGKWPIGTSPP